MLEERLELLHPLVLRLGGLLGFVGLVGYRYLLGLHYCVRVNLGEFLVDLVLLVLERGEVMDGILVLLCGLLIVVDNGLLLDDGRWRFFLFCL